MDRSHKEIQKSFDLGRATKVKRVVKRDTDALVVSSTVPDDNYTGLYGVSESQDGSVVILEPEYHPLMLRFVVSTNNTLPQCIESMCVNIDGTGHTVVRHDGEDVDKEDNDYKFVNDFLNQPSPRQSLIDLRRTFREDLEITGNAYLEVIKDASGAVVFLRNLKSVDMRLVALDAPIKKKVKVSRGGRDFEVEIEHRERRFVRLTGGTQKCFFKEFGATRDLDKNTGKWAKPGETLDVERRASEVLWMSLSPALRGPYGTPRWLSQIPSALGSRKAEELNLSFFDAGGIPPVVIFVEGGAVAESVRTALQSYLSGGASKNQAVIVEAVSSSGGLDSSGSVRVRVERFGSERQSDALFMNYDANTAEHIRMSFRLPQIFLGKSNDYNFATSKTAYMIAEAQVFYPERDRFDAWFNNTIMPLLSDKYILKSSPVTLLDVDQQLNALNMVASAGLSDTDSIVNTVNDLTGMSLVPAENPQPEQPKPEGQEEAESDKPNKPNKDNVEFVVEEEELKKLDRLSDLWLGFAGLVEKSDSAEFNPVWEEIASLSDTELNAFNDLVAKKLEGGCSCG